MLWKAAMVRVLFTVIAFDNVFVVADPPCIVKIVKTYLQ